MTQNKSRRSNIELLRIAAMLGIIIYHITYHAVLGQLGTGEYFRFPVYYHKLSLLVLLAPLGMTGNAVFMLISGYFMCSKSRLAGEKIDLGKTSAKLLTQTGFAVLMLIVASFAEYHAMPDRPVGMIDAREFNDNFWFVGYYFAVILAGALFLNDFFDRLDKREYAAFLLALFAVLSFDFTGKLADGLASGLRIILTGTLMYSLGGYIRRYEPFKPLRAYVFVLAIALAFAVMLISNYNMTAANIQSYKSSGSEDFFKHSILIYSNHSALALIIALAAFELFRRISIRESRLISFLGRSTLMVYLVHDNAFFRGFWREVEWIRLLHDAPMSFALKLAECVGIVFACGVCAYALYLALAAALKKLVPLMYKKEAHTGR